MLKFDRNFSTDEDRSLTPVEAGARGFYTRVFRHQLRLIALITASSLALAVLYLLLAVPIYVATASVVIDMRKAQVLDPQLAARAEMSVTDDVVQTEIELLKSDNVARGVITKLHLIDDPEFAGYPPGFFGSLIARVRSLFATPLDEEQKRARLAKVVLAAFQDKISITRLNKSDVIEIDAQSEKPEKAARIANALADAYLDDKLNATYEQTRRASVWLQERLKELRAQLAAQQQAVVDFRQQHNIVDTLNGQLMSDQQLSEVNSQLILAQAATAEAKARYDRIQQIRKEDVPDASVADALNNQIIIKLRGQYLDDSTRMGVLSQKYGPNHLSVIALRNQMNELQEAIKDEMAKIEQSYKSDYEISLAREQSLQNNLGNAVSKTQLTNQAQVQLLELESAAQTSKTLHDNFLQRYMEGLQQQSFPISEARIVSTADAPITKTYPKTALVLLLALAAGGALGTAAGSIREALDKIFRSSEQVEEFLQVPCLALLPFIKDMPAGLKSQRPSNNAPHAAASSKQPAIRPNKMFDLVLEEPFSQFSEALRTVKVSSDLSQTTKAKKITGVISALSGEGKSTVSANYAQLIANGGGHTLLVDADLRNSNLSHRLGAGRPGLFDILDKEASADELLLRDPRSGLEFLPAGRNPHTPHTNELISSDAMKRLLMSFRERFDYIVVDLPPLVPVADARVSANFIDTYLFIVAWGSTKIDVARHTLSAAPEVRERLLGVIINKVDLAVISRYEPHRSEYFKKYGSPYGDALQA